MWKKKRARKKEKIESKERDRQTKIETDRHTERKEGSTKCLTDQRWIVTIIVMCLLLPKDQSTVHVVAQLGVWAAYHSIAVLHMARTWFCYKWILLCGQI